MSCRARIRASSRPTCPTPKIATAGTDRQRLEQHGHLAAAALDAVLGRAPADSAQAHHLRHRPPGGQQFARSRQPRPPRGCRRRSTPRRRARSPPSSRRPGAARARAPRRRSPARRARGPLAGGRPRPARAIRLHHRVLQLSEARASAPRPDRDPAVPGREALDHVAARVAGGGTRRSTAQNTASGVAGQARSTRCRSARTPRPPRAAPRARRTPASAAARRPPWTRTPRPSSVAFAQQRDVERLGHLREARQLVGAGRLGRAAGRGRSVAGVPAQVLQGEPARRPARSRPRSGRGRPAGRGCRRRRARCRPAASGRPR